MIDYFLSADDEYLRLLGADRTKFPSREEWLRRALADHDAPDERKDRLWVAWIYNGRPVGHSSVNQIRIGEEAYIHLHLWEPSLRKSGLGTEFFRKSVDFYFDRLKLKRLFCEPHAENPAPNKVLPKLGFRLVKRHRTVPGPINFEQDANLYELPRDDWKRSRL
ncbi:MAG: GNAT family N-acetyltransferase [Candidatus Eremiobacteraeota bacterium]|nr:GNAT family N-acetyltransferase [Candidatus Eremiobacteraeota bacterium]